MLDRWLDLWAHATSPHGLGLEPLVFWAMTRQQLEALDREADKPVNRWAMQMAAYLNAHKRPEDTPWLPEDLMGRGDRRRRAVADARSRREAARGNLALAKITPNSPEPADLPDWAKNPRVN